MNSNKERTRFVSFIGRFQLGEKAVVGDPYYQFSDDNTGVARIDVRPGEWNHFVLIENRRVMASLICQSDVSAMMIGQLFDLALYRQDMITKLPVDSGQICFADLENYQDDSTVSNIRKMGDDDDWWGKNNTKWYSAVCWLTLNTPECAGVWRCGAVSGSGWGDGSYPLYKLLDGKAYMVDFRDTSEQEKPVPAYHILSGDWYGKTILEKADYEDEIMIGLYYKDGGCEYEFCIRWHCLKGGSYGSYAKLEMFEESWKALDNGSFTELFLRMSSEINPTVERMKEALKDLGFQDFTKREQG